MKILRAFSIAILGSVILTLAFRYVSKRSAERAFGQIGIDACEMIIPHAQVGGATKNIFEDAQSVLRRHLPEPHFAVEITENGRKAYERPGGDISWYPVHCAIPGRVDIAVDFDFKSRKVFDWELLNWIGINFLWMSLLVLFLEWAVKSAIIGFQETLLQEISSLLGFAGGGASRSMLTKVIRRFFISPSMHGELRQKVDELNRQIERQEKRNIDLLSSKVEREQALRQTNDFLEIVQEIRHDIQGPVQTLADLVEKRIGNEKDRMILASLFHKIRGMLNRLTLEEQVMNKSVDGVRDHVLEAMLKEIVQEKRVLAIDKPIEIDFEFDKMNLCLVKVDSLQFVRVIANLIQNAIEAIVDSGKVTVSVRRHESSAFLIIQDSGRGIPKERLKVLFNKNVTFDKPGGSGLGLYHAKACLERWGGDISIESKFGVGTTIIAQLPLSPAKAKVISRVDRDDQQVNIVVDDDVQVFSQLQPLLGKKSLYFRSAEEFWSWHEEAEPTVKHRYIFDYHLGSHQTGIDLIAKLSSPADAILITNDHDRPEVIQASGVRGFQIFPKTFLQAI